MTAKLRHFALSVPDPQKAAAFYENALGMTRVGENDHPGATAVHLTDGTVNLALLRHKTEAAGGNWLMGEAKEAGAFCEIKFRDPDGVIFDINEGGWKTGE